MDVTTRAVALRATDYKENDKMVTLYSLEYGKISVHAKGVRKASAKLKFACDQFCFGQYELACTNNRYTLKTCQQNESFYSVREDIFAYYAACAIAECILNYTEEQQQDAKVFVALLKALQQLTENTQPMLVVLKFVLDFLAATGFGLDFSHCSVCNGKGKLFLDMQRGGTACDNCRSASSVEIPPSTVSLCSLLDGLAYDKLKNISVAPQLVQQALSLFQQYLAHSFCPNKSLVELLHLA